MHKGIDHTGNSTPSPGGPVSARETGRFNAFFTAHAVAVYRYHLIRSGDPAAAEGRTAQTFRTARQWIGADLSTRDLWQIARHTTKGSFPRPAADPDAAGWDVSQAPSTAASEATQIQRLVTAEAASLVGGLPARLAEAVALRYFAGLSPEEMGPILGVETAEAAARVTRGLAALQSAILSASAAGSEIPPETDAGETIPVTGAEIDLAGDLVGLADRIQPEPGFLQALEANLMEMPAAPARPRRIAWNWKVDQRLRQVFAQAIWAVPAVLIVSLLAINLFLPGDKTPIKPPVPIPTQSPPVPEKPRASGYLVPPDPPVCTKWEHTLADTLKLPASLVSDTPFIDPDQYTPNRNGAGCEIEVTGTGVSFQGIDQALDRISPLLIAQGYRIDGQYGLTDACPTCFQFRHDWYGKGRLFDTDDGRAILTVSWHPYDPNGCPVPGPESGCDVPQALKDFSLRLSLAADPARQALKAFLDAWRSGDSGALAFLTADLRERIPDLQSLDHLTGLQRGQLGRAEMHWQTRSAQRTMTRMEVTLQQGHDVAVLSQDLGTLGIILVPSNGAWRVQDIWSTAFQITQDAAFVADSTGRVYELSIDDQTLVPLSDAGFFRPLGTGGLLAAGAQSHLSPDGEWLAIALPDADGNPPSPDGKKYMGTWLLSTGGSGLRQLDTHPLQLAWSPDSLWMATVSPYDPQGIFLRRVNSSNPAVLSRVGGKIRSLSWSPDGSEIGVVYATQAPNPNKMPGPPIPGLAVAIVHRNGKVDVLATFSQDVPPASLNPEYDLAWDLDNHEVWFGPDAVSIDLNTGETRPLLAQPGSAELYTQQLRMLRTGPALDPLGVVSETSPDGKHLAQAFTEGYLGSPVRVAIRSFQPVAGTIVTQEMGPVAALAWTQDGNDVLVAGGLDETGPLWLMNAHTGLTKVLAPSVYYIGLRSKMQRDSMHQAPQVDLRPAAAVSPPYRWQTYGNASDRIHFRYPQEWNLSIPREGSGWISLSSVEFSNAFGFSSLGHDAIFISITRAPAKQGQAPQDLSAKITADNQDLPTWETLQVGGLTAYRTVRQVHPGDPETIEVPSDGYIYYILKYPFWSVYDPVFEQILRSMEFK